MPLLIATDEAGYGPKLGPLVICASVWQYPSGGFPAAFDPLKAPFQHTQAGKVRVDDSKKIFIAGKQRPTTSLSVPDAILRASARWAGQPHPLRQTQAWLRSLLPLDWKSAKQEPWMFACACTEVCDCEEADAAIVEHWAAGGARYAGCLARLITPDAFNQAIERGLNKADLLTESTCELVMQVLEQWGVDENNATVMSDRHGGRAYYAAPLQQVFSAGVPVVVGESAQNSRYRLRHRLNADQEIELDWSFQVGGDSFSPVGFSSIIAKWIREHSMAGLNQFVADQLPEGKVIRPTAGYPEDAARFIREVNEAGAGAVFEEYCLIRQR